MASLDTSLKADQVEFDDIRPYRDGEVREVISRLEQNKDFVSILSQGLMPATMKYSSFGRYLSLMVFKWQTSGLTTVKGC